MRLILTCISSCLLYVITSFQLNINTRIIRSKNMANPLAFSVPPLMENQTIASWQPFFTAAVTTLTAAEGGEKAAIRLLPAYVKRGKHEEKVVLKVLGLDTLIAAFDYLKERLDPEKDLFVSAEKFREMTWPPGEPATDFFVRYLDEALQVGLTAKHACIFFVTQLPHEIQPKLKDWVRIQEDTLSEDGAMKMVTEVKRALTLKDIPLHQGFRGAPASRIACVTELPKKGSDTESQESDNEVNEVNTFRLRKGSSLGVKRTDRTKGQEVRCYGCEQTGHIVRNCPSKRCGICGKVRHRASNCRTRWNRGVDKKEANWRRGDRIFPVSGGEDAVTIRVWIGGKELSAMLDSGANPCVMDVYTAKKSGTLR